ncbi:hypothetical protein CC2G_008009 [Coprinopsis cinerea AmutBmut pab1-1]|nr:hypothetical protein CC2G_008009 [Coprinopsis cinerea AmutBmut pab1-1]
MTLLPAVYKEKHILQKYTVTMRRIEVRIQLSEWAEKTEIKTKTQSLKFKRHLRYTSKNPTNPPLHLLHHPPHPLPEHLYRSKIQVPPRRHTDPPPSPFTIPPPNTFKSKLPPPPHPLLPSDSSYPCPYRYHLPHPPHLILPIPPVLPLRPLYSLHPPPKAKPKPKPTLHRPNPQRPTPRNDPHSQ